jgi:hypothetical protein
MKLKNYFDFFNQPVFKESLLENNLQENNLQDFCNNYLAYLMDEGFYIEVDLNHKYTNYEKKLVKGKNLGMSTEIKKGYYKYVDEPLGTFFAKITLTKPYKIVDNRVSQSLEFSFNEIKDKFIPFLIFLNKEYQVNFIKFRGKNGLYTIEDILKPNFKFYPKIYILEILINQR